MKPRKAVHLYRRLASMFPRFDLEAECGAFQDKLKSIQGNSREEPEVKATNQADQECSSLVSSSLPLPDSNTVDDKSISDEEATCHGPDSVVVGFFSGRFCSRSQIVVEH